MIDAALNGYGIAYIPEDTVVQHIAAGDLIQVLDDWSPSFAGYYSLLPQSAAKFAGLQGHRRRLTAFRRMIGRRREPIVIRTSRRAAAQQARGHRQDSELQLPISTTG